MSEIKNNNTKLIYAIIAAFIIGWLMVKGYQFNSLPLQEIDIQKIPTILGSLLAITLFIERSIEVIIAIIRSSGAIDLDNAINLKADDIAESGIAGEDVSQKKKELNHLEKDRLIYKSETKKLSIKISFSIGILVSAVGIRALGSLVTDIPSDTTQQVFFNLVDIFITAGLLAGGSEGVHQLTSVYTNYMQNLANTAKGDNA